MSNSNAGLSTAELYDKYDIVKMELDITANELKTKIEKTKLSVSDYVSRLKAQGMSKEEVQQVLITDLKTKGPLFSELRSTFSSPFSASTSRISSTIANYEAAGGDPALKMVWIASFKNTCSSCVPRHGVVKTYGEWATIGLPGNFGSYCNGYCQCRLFPKEYPGVDEMKKPNNRKQWAELMSGKKVSDPAKLPGALVKAEELLIKRQKKIAENIAKAEKKAAEMAAAKKKLDAEIAESKKAFALQKSIQAKAENPLATLEFEGNTQKANPAVLIPGNKNVLGGGNVEIKTFKKFRKKIKGEPEFVLPAHLEGKKELASGVIVKEADGRIWMVEPSGNFGGRGITFPKGRLENGLSPAQNAAKEVYEETGLKIEVNGFVGDYERSTTYTRYYFGKRVGGDPAFAHWETGKVKLLTPDEARIHLQGKVDHEILDDFLNGGQKQELGDRLKSIPGTQKGSNPGGLYLDEKTGQKYYAKFYQNADQARSEYAANEIARSIGLGAPESELIEMVGPSGRKEFSIVTKWEEGLQKLNLKGPNTLDEFGEQIAKHHLNAALVENWDVVGLEYDNLLLMPDGKIIVVDSGGSFRFRAQGLNKPYLASPDAFDSLLDPGKNYQAHSVLNPVFEKYTKANSEKLAAWLKEIDEDRISEIFQKSGMQDWRELKSNFLSRKNELIKRLEAFKKIESKKSFVKLVDISPETAKAIKKARLNGMTLNIDKKDVEDVSVLFWEEIGKDGNPVLKARLRVSTEAGQRIDEMLREELGEFSGVRNEGRKITGFLDEDVFWNDIEKAAKTIGYHAKDGAYNEASVKKMVDHISAIMAMSKSGNMQLQNMGKYYSKVVADLLEAKAAQKVPSRVWKRFKLSEAEIEAIKAENVRPIMKRSVMVEPVTIEGKVHDKGVARVTAGDVTPDFLEGKRTYSFDIDGGKVKYHPWFYDSELQYTLRGQIDIAIEGGSTPANIKKVLKGLEDLGIDSNFADDLYIESLYLHKQVVLMGEHTKAWYLKIQNSAHQLDEKIEMIKSHFEKKLKIQVRDNPAYQPFGNKNSFGEGRTVWKRFDLSDEKIAEEMKGYFVIHDKQGRLTMPELIENILNSGGECSCTNERLRRGVNAAGTMSPGPDFRSGGGNYWFTRIYHENSAHDGYPDRFVWRPNVLRRLDSMSRRTDTYGEMNHINPGRSASELRRFSKPDEWKDKCAPISNNETLFKNGLDMFEDLEVIYVRRAEREKILESFRNHGYSEWPDGRKLEDVIRESSW